MMSIALTLYVSGNTLQSERAVATSHRLCEAIPNQDCTLKIVNVLEDPHLAEENNILATPTLIREFPLPLRRIIGDLSDIRKVALMLGVDYDDDKERS